MKFPEHFSEYIKIKSITKVEGDTVFFENSLGQHRFCDIGVQIDALNSIAKRENKSHVPFSIGNIALKDGEFWFPGGHCGYTLDAMHINQRSYLCPTKPSFGDHPAMDALSLKLSGDHPV